MGKGSKIRKNVAENNNFKTAEKKSSSVTFHAFTTIIIAVICGILHSVHVNNLYENDRNFSHLSNLEREMGFRTEMGLYYSYFKNMIEAPSFSDGLYSLYSNNITEYPDRINVLKRFNLYPEVFLGGLFRIYRNVGESLKWKTKECWNVNRGDERSMVQSCEGLGEPTYFYTYGVWTISGITTSFIYILGVFLSSSQLGGCLAVASFFFNHEESTRVMWTPPLRESFGYPISIVQIYFVTKTLKADESTWSQLLSIWMSTMIYMLFWQFAQFTLFTQLVLIFGLHVTGFVNRANFTIILGGLFMGVLSSTLLLFGNEMLITSWLFSAQLSAIVVLYVLDKVLNVKYTFLRMSLQTILFIVGTGAFKVASTKLLNIKDDAHIWSLLKAKFTEYKDFDTMLYTCAREFDYLGWEMPEKTTKTLLLPSAILAVILVASKAIRNIFFRSKEQSEEADPAILYTVGQTSVYALMAVGIMRLKLFLTPHLCLLVALLADIKYIPMVKTRALHWALVAALFSGMTFQGYQNIRHEYSRLGEFSDPMLEDLIDWVNLNTPTDASFAGPMPVMANLMLSTRRPIVNHPHYEDASLRQRTKLVYRMFSRRSAEEYYQTVTKLGVNYVVIATHYCPPREDGHNPCSMTSLFDLEEEARALKGNKPLCRQLITDQHPSPFIVEFSNPAYVVLRVPQKFVEIPPNKKCTLSNLIFCFCLLAIMFQQKSLTIVIALFLTITTFLFMLRFA